MYISEHFRTEIRSFLKMGGLSNSSRKSTRTGAHCVVSVCGILLILEAINLAVPDSLNSIVFLSLENESIQLPSRFLDS